MSLTLEGARVFVNSTEVAEPRLFWKPCSKTDEKATLLCLKDGRVTQKSISWLLHPLYKGGDDDATCKATNALFAPAVEAHGAARPHMLFRHGAEEMHAHEDLLIDFRGRIHGKPAHVLFQRTGSTATFDACFFWGQEYLETFHIERKYFAPLLDWFQNLACPILDTGTDPVSPIMIRDALLDLPLAEVVELIRGPESQSDDSEYFPSEDEIEYERTERRSKRKRT